MNNGFNKTLNFNAKNYNLNSLAANNNQNNNAGSYLNQNNNTNGMSVEDYNKQYETSAQVQAFVERNKLDDNEKQFIILELTKIAEEAKARYAEELPADSEELKIKQSIEDNYLKSKIAAVNRSNTVRGLEQELAKIEDAKRNFEALPLEEQRKAYQEDLKLKEQQQKFQEFREFQDTMTVIGYSFAAGFMEPFENVFDGLAMVGAILTSSAVSIFDEKKAAEIQDYADKLISFDISGAVYDESVKGISRDIAYGKAHAYAQTAGTMTGYILMSMAVGGAATSYGTSAGFSTAVTQTMSNLATGTVSAFAATGSSAETAFNNGATFDEAAKVSMISGGAGFIAGSTLDKLSIAAKGAQGLAPTLGYMTLGGAVASTEPVINSVAEYNIYGKDMVDENGNKLYDGFGDYYKQSGGLTNTIMAFGIGAGTVGMSSFDGYRARNPKDSNIGALDDALVTKNSYKGNDKLGGNQDSFYDKYTKTIKSKSLKNEVAELEGIIKQYKPEYTDKEILDLATKIKKSGCSSVDVANNIFEQLNYDSDTFYNMFGYSMYNNDGSLNHDALIVDIAAFFEDKIELKVNGSYKTFNYDSNITAANQMLGGDFKTNADAVIALTENNIRIDGTTYTYFDKNPSSYIGDYKDIGKQLGIEASSIDDLQMKLKQNGIVANIDGKDIPSKLTTLNVNNHDTWMNLYFKNKGINLEFKSQELHFNDYDSLISELNSNINSGKSISVGVRPSSNVSMTDGTKFGWFNFGDFENAGHAMSFRGINDAGDIVVSSWGAYYTIPKEYALDLEFTSRKLKSIFNTENIVSNSGDYINTNYFDDIVTERLVDFNDSDPTVELLVTDESIITTKLAATDKLVDVSGNDVTEQLNGSSNSYLTFSKDHDISIKQLSEYYGDAGSQINGMFLAGDTAHQILTKLSGQEKLDFEYFLKNTRQGQYLASLSDLEINSMVDYTGGGYRLINEYLRSKVPFGSNIDLQNVINNVDSAIAKYGGLDEPTELYRAVDISAFKSQNSDYEVLFNGLDLNNLDQVYSVLKVLEGKEFGDVGYMSTSPAYSASFAKYNGYPIVLKIFADEGTNGAYINQISRFYNEECEFLLARGTNLQMKKVCAPSKDIRGLEKIVIECIIK